MFVSMAPAYFITDYNTEGGWESGTHWATFDDKNYPFQIKPHEVVDDARSPFEIQPEKTRWYKDFKLK